MRTGRQNLLIVGERGSGKTWLLRHFALEQLKRHLESPWDTPPAFYLNLRSCASTLQSTYGAQKNLAYCFFDCLQSSLFSMDILHLYIWELIVESGAAILLLDGFDELAQEVTDRSLVRHLERLKFLLPPCARVVLTTWGTVFPSLSSLVEVFSGEPPVSDRSQVSDHEFVSGEEVAASLHHHAIYAILPFSKADLTELARKRSESRHGSDPGQAEPEKLLETLLIAAHNGGDGVDALIRGACRTLGTIPACAHYLLSFLHSQSPDTPIPLIRLFEMSLLGPLVSYNIASQRSLESYEYRIPATGTIVEQDLDVAQKLMLSNTSRGGLSSHDRRNSTRTTSGPLH